MRFTFINKTFNTNNLFISNLINIIILIKSNIIYSLRANLTAVKAFAKRIDLV